MTFPAMMSSWAVSHPVPSAGEETKTAHQQQKKETWRPSTPSVSRDMDQKKEKNNKPGKWGKRSGFKLQDKKGNGIEKTSTGTVIKDSVKLKFDSPQVEYTYIGSSLVHPNILPTDPMTGSPHGGKGGGVTGWKGSG